MDARPDNSVARPEQPVILVVDDDDIVRGFMLHVLEAAGYFVLIAVDGAQGLEVARRFAARIDLMVTDVIMPRMDGLALREQILRERPELKVLLISGTFEREVRSLPFLRKPFQADDFRSRVRELLMDPGAGSAPRTNKPATKAAN